MPVTTDPNLDEPTPDRGRGNRLPQGDHIDRRDLGMAGLRMLLDAVLESVEGFGREHLEAVGIGPRDLVRYRPELAQMLTSIIAQEGRRDLRRRQRCAALRILGHLRIIETLPAIAGVLRSSTEDPSVRSAAADALGFLRDEQAIEPLRAQLDDGHAMVRARVVAALGKVGGESAIADVENVLVTAADPGERLAAHHAITSLLERHERDRRLPALELAPGGGRTREVDPPPVDKWALDG